MPLNYVIPKKVTSGVHSTMKFYDSIIPKLDHEIYKKIQVDVKFKYLKEGINPKRIAYYQTASSMKTGKVERSIVININSKGFIYMSAPWEIEKMNSKQDWHSSSSWNHTLIHELGHAYSLAFSDLPVFEDLINKVLLRYFKNLGVVDGEVKTLPSKEMKNLIEDHISVYGKKNFKEAFAEMFCLAYTFSENKKKWFAAKDALSYFAWLIAYESKPETLAARAEALQRAKEKEKALLEKRLIAAEKRKQLKKEKK